MGVPTETELEIALAEAARMREQGEDPHHLAKVLLNHHYQLEVLEKVMRTADVYLHSGESGHEHSLLVKAIETAKHSSVNTIDSSPLEYGL